MSYTWTPVKPDPDMDLAYALNAAKPTDFDGRHDLTRIELASGSILSNDPLIRRYQQATTDSDILFFTDSYHVVHEDDYEKFSFDTRTIVSKTGACRVCLHFTEDESSETQEICPRVFGTYPFRFIEHVAPLFLTKTRRELVTKFFAKPAAMLDLGTVLVHTSSEILARDKSEYERFAFLCFDDYGMFRETYDRRFYIEQAIDKLLDEANRFWNLKALINTEGPAFDRLIKEILFQPTSDDLKQQEKNPS